MRINRRWNMTKKELVEFLLSNVTKTKSPDHVKGRCWESVLGARIAGYAVIGFEGKTHRAHRLVLEHKRGEPLGKLQANHYCDNPACIRPSHLYAGTQQQNMRDMQRRGRGRWASGEAAGPSKLTAKQVCKIREQYATGDYSQQALATTFGVSQPTVHGIVHTKYWKQEAAA